MEYLRRAYNAIREVLGLLEEVRALAVVHLHLATQEVPELFDVAVDLAAVYPSLLHDATRQDQGLLLSDPHRALGVARSLCHNASVEGLESVAMDLVLELKLEVVRVALQPDA
jgi:hypothetical protein